MKKKINIKQLIKGHNIDFDSFLVALRTMLFELRFELQSRSNIDYVHYETLNKILHNAANSYTYHLLDKSTNNAFYKIDISYKTLKHEYELLSALQVYMSQFVIRKVHKKMDPFLYVHIQPLSVINEIIQNDIKQNTKV